MIINKKRQMIKITGIIILIIKTAIIGIMKKKMKKTQGKSKIISIIIKTSQ